MAKGKGDNAARPIIIKKVKKTAHGRHGGAWKVAYADFVTAMMAFFMLLWLLTISDKVTLQGIADYFTPSNATMSNASGAGGILAGTALESEGAKASGSNLTATPSSSPSKDSKDSEDARNQSRQEDQAPTYEMKLPPTPDARLLKAEDDLKTAIQETPDLAKYRDQILLEQTPEGLRIQLIDRDERPMFRPGTATPYPFYVRILQTVADVVKAMPNRISITGHTDGAVYANEGQYGNWELSADRANATRRVLRDAGVRPDRMAEVTGRAATQPLYPDAPNRPENRRVAILLLREAPALAPAFAGGN
ncbi:flagellar motor protein MotB [Pedomonas sp. V897]|uniref:flagellar motor protein MotB n=1 Tax=Pedomonas sp. V897 TaxID=3446482 RepID=UPI003EE37C8B